MKKFLIRAALVFVVLLLIFAAVAYFYPEKFLCVDSGGTVKADVIIVLGGGVNERPVRAAALFKAQAAPRVIHTGKGDDAINRQLLIENGVPASAIELEKESKTTYENAIFTVKLLRAKKVKSAILVTSWYHSRRALATFEHVAPEIKFYSRPSYYGFKREDWTSSGTGQRLRLEYLKLAGYIFRHGVFPLGL